MNKTVSPQVLLLGLVVLLIYPSFKTRGFALIGPYSDWMAPTNTYRMGWDVGGPVDISERYRWNVPVVTYGFDQSFLTYFGSNGVNAVQKAIQIINDLPPASAIVLTNFPIAALKYNYLASSQQLFDLKTATLGLLVEQLGLAEPERSIFVLRQWSPVFITLNDEANWPSWVIPDFIIERNYDPETLQVSHYVNGNRFTGFVALTYGGFSPSPFLAWVEPFLIDPLDTHITATADLRSVLRPGMGSYFGYGNLYEGAFFDGLTQDDIGGLRYLLSTTNVSLETLLPDVHAAGTNAGSVVDLAKRPGVDKITFVPQPYDSVLGRFLPFTNQFVDTFFTNGVIQHQQLERVTTEPDFLFSAVDASETNNQTPFFIRTGVEHWWNSATASGAVGPGVIRPPVQITFNELGPTVQTDDQSLGQNVSATFANLRWASFDSSTNPSILYPPVPVITQTNGLIFHQWLFDFYKTNSGVYDSAVRWVVPVPLGGSAMLQTSTNLADWISLGAVSNHGASVNWRHFYYDPQRYFRVIPQ